MGVSRANMNGRGRVFPKRRPTNMEAGLRHGFRSGLEEQNGRLLRDLGVAFKFEETRIPYTVPESKHHYTPDFELPNGILIETKGKFEPKDRAKHLFVKDQHPDLDIRLVFQRPHDPIVKGSRTSYAMWCDKHHIKWACRTIPQHWVEEAGPDRKPSEVLRNV